MKKINEKDTQRRISDRAVLYIVLGVIALVAIVAAATCVIHIADAKYKSTHPSTAESESGGDDINEELDYKLADKDTIEPFWKYTIGDKEVEMPFKLAELEAMGYTFETEDISEYMIKPGTSHLETVFAVDEENHSETVASIEVYNNADKDVPEKDCYIVSFEIYNDNKLSNSFSLAKGIKFGSKKEAVHAVFGEPGLTDTDDELTQDYWILDSSFFNILCIGYEDGLVSSISIDYSEPFEEYDFLPDNQEDEEIEIEDVSDEDNIITIS